MKPRRRPPSTESPTILVSHGRIVGYRLQDGTIVKLRDCCANPYACQREECWSPWPRQSAWSRFWN